MSYKDGAASKLLNMLMNSTGQLEIIFSYQQSDKQAMAEQGHTQSFNSKLSHNQWKEQGDSKLN